MRTGSQTANQTSVNHKPHLLPPFKRALELFFCPQFNAPFPLFLSTRVHSASTRCPCFFLLASSANPRRTLLRNLAQNVG